MIWIGVVVWKKQFEQQNKFQSGTYCFVCSKLFISAVRFCWLSVLLVLRSFIYQSWLLTIGRASALIARHFTVIFCFSVQQSGFMVLWEKMASVKIISENKWWLNPLLKEQTKSGEFSRRTGKGEEPFKTTLLQFILRPMQKFLL